MDRTGCGDVLDGAMQRFDSPVGRLVQVDVEGRLVELDHVDAVGSEAARFFVQQRRERHRHLDAVAVVSVRDGIDDGHRARQGEFQFPAGMGAGKPRFAGVNARAQPRRAGDGRTHRLVAIVADAHFDAALEVDAFDGFEEAVDEMLTRLLAVGDDVNARIFLQFDASSVASSLPANNCSPWRRHGAQSLFGSASHDGFGKLPANMVGNRTFWLVGMAKPRKLCILTLMSYRLSEHFLRDNQWLWRTGMAGTGSFFRSSQLFRRPRKVDAPLDLGDVGKAGGVSSPSPVESFQVRSSRHVLPGGADWQVLRDDGIAELEARYTLRTDDAALIYVVRDNRVKSKIIANLTKCSRVKCEKLTSSSPLFPKMSARKNDIKVLKIGK